MLVLFFEQWYGAERCKWRQTGLNSARLKRWCRDVKNVTWHLWVSGWALKVGDDGGLII